MIAVGAALGMAGLYKLKLQPLQRELDDQRAERAEAEDRAAELQRLRKRTAALERRMAATSRERDELISRLAVIQEEHRAHLDEVDYRYDDLQRRLSEATRFWHDSEERLRACLRELHDINRVSSIERHGDDPEARMKNRPRRARPLRPADSPNEPQPA